MTEKEKIEELATLLLRSINKRKGQTTMLDLASDMIQEGYSRQPEIVKCKNCAYSEIYDGVLGPCRYCTFWDKDTDDDTFCSKGV